MIPLNTKVIFSRLHSATIVIFSLVLGLGVVAANVNRVTDEMLMVASETLAEASPIANTGEGELLPPLTEIANLSKKIAFAVAKVAYEQGLALRIEDEALEAKIERNFWQPEYRPISPL